MTFTRTKRILGMLLSFCLCILMLPQFAFAASPMSVTGVVVTNMDLSASPFVATVAVFIDNIGLTVDNFTVTNLTNPSLPATVTSVVYSTDHYMLSISGMTYYDNYSLTIAADGYDTYVNASFYGTLATAPDLDLVHELNIFPTYSRALTSEGVVTISNNTYEAGIVLRSGAVYDAIDSNNGYATNDTSYRVIGIFVVAPEGAKGVTTLRPTGAMLPVGQDSLINANPNYQETVANGNNEHSPYEGTLAFLPLYAQIATERQSDGSRVLTDPADRFRIIAWYGNEACTGIPIKVTRLMVKTEYASPASNDTPAYVHTTLSNAPSGLNISGVMLEGAAFNVAPYTSSSDAAGAAIASQMSSKQSTLLFSGNLSLTKPYSGKITLAIPVSAAYNGQEVTLLQNVGGSLVTLTAVAKNGLAVFEVEHLGSVALFGSVINAGVPNTGDSYSLVLLAALLVCIGLSGMAITMRRFARKG